MSRKKKTRKGRCRRKGMPARARQISPLRIPKGDASFWARFEEYNRLDPKLRGDALKKLGIEVYNNDVLGQLTKSHFVIPGKTRYQCQQCGECCRYARKVATFTYEPCPFLRKDNLCAKHETRYQVCKWFPFWVYPDKRYGNLLVIKPYCTGYGRGEPVEYETTVIRLLELRQSTTRDPDGAQVIHEVIYLPTRKEWAFPSGDNVDELIRAVSKSTIEGDPEKSTAAPAQLDHARRYTSGLLSGVNDANITVNEDGLVTDANEAAVSLLGRERDQLVGTEFSGLFTDSERASGVLRTCFALGKITGLPQKIIHKNGKTMPTLCDAMTYRDHVDGVVHGVLVAACPVSEHVFNELEKARNYARGLIESSLDLMVTFNRSGVITDVNEEAVRITGCSRDELIGAGFRDFFADPDLADVGIQRVFKEGQVRNHELELQNQSGKTIPVSFNATVYRGVDGMVIGAFATARDIRGIRQTIRKLEKARNYARGLIESSLDPMVTLNRDGIISDVNEAAVSITGCRRDDLIGIKFRDFFADPELADTGIQKVFEKGRVRDYELDLQNRSGMVIPVSFNATEHRDDNGEVLGIFAVARERKGY